MRLCGAFWQPNVPAVSAWCLKRQVKNPGRKVLTFLRTSAAWARCITVSRYMTRAEIQYVLGLCVLKYCLEGVNVHQNRASPQVCAGIRSKHLTSSDLAQLPPESIPAGEFKACTALKHVYAHHTNTSSGLPTEHHCHASQSELPAVYVRGVQLAR